MTERSTASVAPWQIWQSGIGGPLIATAIHDGHASRPEVTDRFALNDAERLREEDPFTAAWVDVAPVRVVAAHSRFEVDLNRPRDKAVYQVPEDAWGLNVWKEGPLSDAVVMRSLADYDAFYADVYTLLQKVEREHGAFVVLDLHTYNHRRDGVNAAPASALENPEVNIGTGTMADRAAWASFIDRFISDFRRFDYQGRSLDVRENVKFKGGQFGRWIHEKFPRSGCALSVEFKKFFMDEWSGEPDPAQVDALRQALASTVPGILESLAAMKRRAAA
ncbi:MAG: N-formylglutamate amidohydrolase [Armatimonadota bacterium]